MRVLIVSGKGGVGKTTVAAATATACVAQGFRTLVVSTDCAHSLADVFSERIGHDPVRLGDQLWGQQVDTRLALERSWLEIRDYLTELVSWAGIDGLVAEELLVVPGMQEVFALENVLIQANSGRFDRIIVDCAPTAETLRLLELPEALDWYLERLFPSHRRLARFTRPLLRRTVDMPLAEDAIFDAVLQFTARMREVRTLLTDPAQSSVRLVATPESLVIDEARRLYASLCLFGYPVDGVVVNRLLPETERGTPLLDAWHRRQDQQCEALDEAFANVPMWQVALRPFEPIGHHDLLHVGRELYGDMSPIGVPAVDQPLRFTEQSDGVVLTITMPGYCQDQIDVAAADGELIITAGSHRRAMLLPEGLRSFGTVGAQYDGEALRVKFTRNNSSYQEVAYVD